MDKGCSIMKSTMNYLSPYQCVFFVAKVADGIDFSSA